MTIVHSSRSTHGLARNAEGEIIDVAVKPFAVHTTLAWSVAAVSSPIIPVARAQLGHVIVEVPHVMSVRAQARPHIVIVCAWSLGEVKGAPDVRACGAASKVGAGHMPTAFTVNPRHGTDLAPELRNAPWSVYRQLAVSNAIAHFIVAIVRIAAPVELAVAWQRTHGEGIIVGSCATTGGCRASPAAVHLTRPDQVAILWRQATVARVRCVGGVTETVGEGDGTVVDRRECIADYGGAFAVLAGGADSRSDFALTADCARQTRFPRSVIVVNPVSVVRALTGVGALPGLGALCVR